jgi:hypothetical protein
VILFTNLVLWNYPWSYRQKQQRIISKTVTITVNVFLDYSMIMVTNNYFVIVPMRLTRMGLCMLESTANTRPLIFVAMGRTFVSMEHNATTTIRKFFDNSIFKKG